MYLVGHPFPMKCVPSSETISAVNFAKRHLYQPNRAFYCLQPYFLAWHELSPPARELGLFAEKLGASSLFVVLLTHIFHYDQAYLWRLQDLFSCTTKRELAAKPLKTLWRLKKIHAARDGILTLDGAVRPTKALHRKFFVAWLVLSLFVLVRRKTFVRAMQEIEYRNLLPDPGDLYWMSKRTDYQFDLKPL